MLPNNLGCQLIEFYPFLKPLQRAFRQYEQAMGAAANMADRMSQMEAMDGAARCLESLRLQVSFIVIVSLRHIYTFMNL